MVKNRLLLFLFSVSIFVLLLLLPFVLYSFPYFSGNWFWSEILPLLTKNEFSHMQDVFYIFDFVFCIFVTALFIFFVSIIWFIFSKHRKYIILWFIYWSLASLILIWFISFFVVVDFWNVFVFFHEVFFPQGNWTFDQTSILINLFPLDFFEMITMKIFSSSLVFSLIFFAWSLYLLKRTKKII